MKKFLLLTVFCTVSMLSFADSWIDPSWKRMLDESDVVATIQYTSNGAFRAKAKILSVYKGLLKPGDEISLSGFSNKFGPIDTVRVGDKFLVFIKLNEPEKYRLKRWKEDVKKEPSLKEFADLYKSRKSYQVWSPTSGDLKLRSDSIQYDLVQTTFYSNQGYQILSSFEQFLEAYYNESKRENFVSKLLSQLSDFREDHVRVQYLFMLNFLGYDQYKPMLRPYTSASKPFIRYATAQLLGNMKDNESRELLVALIRDSVGFVQGEAVRQLEKQPPDFLGPILVANLKQAVPGDYGPSDIMNPVRNTLDGGKTQLIETIGNIGYKEAIPVLLPMLETKDGRDFKLVVYTLRKLGTREYADYINKHLRNLEYAMILDLCFIVDEDSLTQCIPSLIYFVENHDRLKWPTHDIAISQYFGLGKFWSDPEVMNFLLSDFQKLNKLVPSPEQLESKKQWVKSYLEMFTEWNIKEAKSTAYDLMYDYWGLNNAFKTNPGLFEQKRQKEDSIKRSIEEKVGSGISELNVVVYLDVYTGNIKDYTAAMKLNKESAEQTMTTLKAMDLDDSHVIFELDEVTYGSRTQESLGSMISFLYYFGHVADNSDIAFLSNLGKYGYARSDYEKERLESFLLLATNKGKWERKNKDY